MTDHELEQHLRDWYRAEVPADEVAPAALRSSVAAIPRSSSAPSRPHASRRGITLLAAAALVGLLAGSAVLGARFLAPPPVPTMVPSQVPAVLPSELPSNLPSIAPIAGRIVYTRWKTLRNGEEDCTTRSLFCHRASVFISNDDGSGERELLPGLYNTLLAVSPDGSNVIVRMRDPDGDHVYVTDTTGADRVRLDTHCDAPCFEDDGFVFSPDGARLAFLRTRTDETAVIAIMDMASGTVEELESTLGIAAPPSWSPDGSHLAFNHHVVAAEGGNLRQIAPDTLFTGLFGEAGSGYSAPQWSPDGSQIAFASFNDTFPTNPPERNSQRLMDIYLVRPDGAELRRLTTDTVGPLGTNDPGDFGAALPTWTRDGRITFTRLPIPPRTEIELWVIDPDGTDATRLDPSDAAALTALGCMSCAYPALEEFRVRPFAYWIPAR
jgi:Tol biopolymer transport system component